MQKFEGCVSRQRWPNFFFTISPAEWTFPIHEGMFHWRVAGESFKDAQALFTMHMYQRDHGVARECNCDRQTMRRCTSTAGLREAGLKHHLQRCVKNAMPSQNSFSETTMDRVLSCVALFDECVLAAYGNEIATVADGDPGWQSIWANLQYILAEGVAFYNNFSGIAKIHEYACRFEFQGRGTIHVHVLAWADIGVKDSGLLSGRTRPANNRSSLLVRFLERMFKCSVDFQRKNGAHCFLR